MSDLLNVSQRRFLDSLLEHPCAPRYNFQSNDMLDARSLERVKEFERNLWTQTFWPRNGYPDWLEAFVDRVCRTVPYYRTQGRPASLFEAIPTMDRQALKDEPWSLVPDDLDLEELTVYTTSGTSGTKLAVPAHPIVPSMLLVLMEKLLSQSLGLSLPRGEGEVAIALICCQRDTLTYASLSSYLGGAGFLKVNLAPSEWNDLSHRADFLRQCKPAVLTGDPYAFSVLAELAPDLRPTAMLSSAVALHPGMKEHLESVFECPVLDIYSMTEARFISASAGRGEQILQAADLYVEILGERDQPLNDGTVGEITLTGGRNPFFPLLRYKTGDRAALRFRGGQPYLERFEGREPVRLENARGEVIPTLDVVHVLRHQPIVGFSLQQRSSKEVHFQYAGPAPVNEVEDALGELFGLKVRAVQSESWEGKPQRFGSSLVQ